MGSLFCYSVICGFTDTPIVAEFIIGPEALADMSRSMPMRRPGVVDELGATSV